MLAGLPVELGLIFTVHLPLELVDVKCLKPTICAMSPNFLMNAMGEPCADPNDL